MQSFFSDPGGVGRDVALASLRRDIVGLLGGPARLHDALFLDAPFADGFATDDCGRLYVIRWIDGAEFAPSLVHTLGEVVRLAESGRVAAARLFGLPENFPDPVLILVSDRIDETWVRVVSVLKLPVILLRAHSLVDGTRASAGCLFEKRFASPLPPAPAGFRRRPPLEPAPASAPAPPRPRRDAEPLFPRPTPGPGPAADLRLAAVDLDEPVEDTDQIRPDEDLETAPSAPAFSAPSPPPSGMAGSTPNFDAPGSPTDGAPEFQGLESADRDDVASASPDDEDAGESTAPVAASAQAVQALPHAWASPRALLSDEELATFKLLETMLQSRN